MDEPEFKSFSNTYRMITFTLSISAMYPNPNTEKQRLLTILFMFVSVAPVASMILIDMYFSWLEGDIVNIIRHSTVIGPFLAGLLKILLMFYKRNEAKKLIDEISYDYHLYNELPDCYKTIVKNRIKNNLVYSERAWVILVIFCVMTFPVMATVQNFYSFSFKSEPTKYMIHDLNKPFSEKEERFDSPFFEIMYVYMFYSSIIYVVNFIGYDGFFGLCINHACLKMELYCKSMEDAMKAENVSEKIVEVINEQNKMFEFVNIIQDTFNIWLGLIFLATMIQICTCLYHISEGYGFDLRYMVFVFGAVVHIYLPCRYAAKLKAMSVETATKIYSCGWENVHNQGVRKMVLFMIARGQIPIEITAFNMLTFDMELFVSIMQTSYSMFTLLRS